MENENKEKDWCEEFTEKVEQQIKEISAEGVNTGNVDYLYRLVDIHKDLKNEEYWKEKIDMYRESYGNYGDYNDYNGGRRRDSRGRYMEGESYGRRGVKGTGRGRYRGEEMMDEMAYHYGNYNEGREQYGADEETMKSFNYMLKSFKDYYKHLKEEASSQQEVKMLEDVAREISEM